MEVCVQGGVVVPGVAGGGDGGVVGGDGVAPAGLLQLLLQPPLQQLLAARVVEVVAVHSTQALHRRYDYKNTTCKARKRENQITGFFSPVHNARHPEPNRPLWQSPFP